MGWRVGGGDVVDVVGVVGVIDVVDGCWWVGRWVVGLQLV
jgi:hypothetical protein